MIGNLDVEHNLPEIGNTEIAIAASTQTKQVIASRPPSRSKAATAHAGGRDEMEGWLDCRATALMTSAALLTFNNRNCRR